MRWVRRSVMETNHSSTRPTREQVRQQFLETAAAAFDLMFGDANQQQLVTLSQREDMACALGKNLSRFLLAQHVGGDIAAQPEPTHVCCPKCGRRAGKAKRA